MVEFEKSSVGAGVAVTLAELELVAFVGGVAMVVFVAFWRGVGAAVCETTSVALLVLRSVGAYVVSSV